MYITAQCAANYIHLPYKTSVFVLWYANNSMNVGTKSTNVYNCNNSYCLREKLLYVNLHFFSPAWFFRFHSIHNYIISLGHVPPLCTARREHPMRSNLILSEIVVGFGTSDHEPKRILGKYCRVMLDHPYSTSTYSSQNLLLRKLNPRADIS